MSAITSTYLERYNAEPSCSAEQRAVIDAISKEFEERGTPTEGAMRAQLRVLMSECPACTPADVDDVPGIELAGWILSHGAEPSGCAERVFVAPLATARALPYVVTMCPDGTVSVDFPGNSISAPTSLDAYHCAVNALRRCAVLVGHHERGTLPPEIADGFDVERTMAAVETWRAVANDLEARLSSESAGADLAPGAP